MRELCFKNGRFSHAIGCEAFCRCSILIDAGHRCSNTEENYSVF